MPGGTQHASASLAARGNRIEESIAADHAALVTGRIERQDVEAPREALIVAVAASIDVHSDASEHAFVSADLCVNGAWRDAPDLVFAPRAGSFD
jgi:hypothetical protein